MPAPLALIVGTGSGLSAALARRLSQAGYDLVLTARDVDKLADLATETGATLRAMDGADPSAMAALFDEFGQAPRVAVYNPSARIRGPITEVGPAEVRRALDVTAYGAFLMGQAAARAMLSAEPHGGVRGTILFTGASAGVKGFPQSASFAMGKFAQRGLAQSMARELHPQGIHVAWINIDGAIASPGRGPNTDNAMLDPDAIAGEYMRLIDQHPSAWSQELELRPLTERF